MQTDVTENQGYHSYKIASFARWAKIYDAFAALLQIQRVRRKTVEMSRGQPGDRVLDVCTGTGEVALAFASSDFEGLLARCGLEEMEKPVYGGFVRLCLVSTDR